MPAIVGGTLKERYQQIAREVLEAQNAVNLSGVAHSFAEATSVLWEVARHIGAGTDYVNRHPIVTLYLDKLTDLNSELPYVNADADKAYSVVRYIAETGDP